jgi:hypothetical protein
VSGWDRRLVVLIGLGSFLNLFEIALGSFLRVLLGAQWSLSKPGPVDDRRGVVLRRDGYAGKGRFQLTGVLMDVEPVFSGPQ